MIVPMLLLLFLAALPTIVLGVPLLVILVYFIVVLAVQVAGIFLALCSWVAMFPAALIAELIGAIKTDLLNR